MNAFECLFLNGSKFTDGRSPWPAPILLYNGRKKWKKLPTMPDAVGVWKNSPCAKEFERLFVPQFNYCAIDLAAMSVQELQGGLMLRTFLEVMKRATDGTLVDAMLGQQLPWSVKENNWNVYSFERVETFIKKSLRYINTVSKTSRRRIASEEYQNTVEAIEDPRIKNTMKSFIEEFEDKAYTRGHNEGRYESIFDLTQKYLCERFDKVPQRLLNKIDAIDDYPTFENVLRYFWNAKSLKEMENYVDQIVSEQE